MPSSQWVKLPPNLVHDKSTAGKSIYQTDFSSRRPLFQIHMQKSGTRSSHHPKPPKDKDRHAMRMSQTADYMTLQDAFERDFATRANNSDIKLKTALAPNDSPPAGTENERAVLSKYIRPSLQLVEKSWMDESQAGKRDRDRMYQSDVSGIKAGLHTRPTKNEAKNTKGLPGLNNWLKSSNEYEKAVVFNFMDSISKATKKPAPPRPATPQRRLGTPAKADLSNEYFHRHIQRPKSVRSQRVSEKPQLPPRPSSVNSLRNEAVTWPRAPAQQQGNPTEVTETHHYHPPPHVHHTEGKCEVCDYYRVRKMLELIKGYDRSKLGESTLAHLLRPRVDPAYHNPEDGDYVHDNSFFTLTNARDRGYFIISPDWVSERKAHPRYK